MQVSDWLVVGLIIAIVVVLLDGVRRKLRDRRNRVVVKLDRNIPAEPLDEDAIALAELPNGGARTLPRQDRPVPTLRNLKSVRKALVEPPPSRRVPPASSAPGPVPVLMDAVDVEEEQIEHTNVFADSSDPDDFLIEEYEEVHTEFGNVAGDHDDDSDEDDEEDAEMLASQPENRRHEAIVQPVYQGDDDDDDYALDEEEEFDEIDDDEDDELLIPDVAEVEDDDEEEEEDEDDDEDDFDDFEDDFDDDDEEDEDEEDEDDDDLDELGFPDDNFGSEDELELLADDYESEPVLLESTYDKAASHFNRPARQQRIEPGFGNDTFDESELDEDFSAARSDAGDEGDDEEQQGAAEAIRQASHASDVPVAGWQDQTELFQENRPGGRAQAPPSEPAPAPGPQEVIIINVMARTGQQLAGYELLPVLQQQGLRLGDMSIFHRHAETDGNGPLVFSMANMVKPGTFELAAMEEFTTPGVSLFLQLPNLHGNMQAFELMLGTATALRNALDGELKDENRSVFTRQTVEHCRQRIRDFELKLLSKKH